MDDTLSALLAGCVAALLVLSLLVLLIAIFLPPDKRTALLARLWRKRIT